jgi:mannose-6-phosphate isomerase-like protein (cupin superfamily)
MDFKEVSVSYTVAHLDELDEFKYRDSRLRPVRHHLGMTAFGVNAWTGHAAGDRLIPEHEEDEHEELYVVLQGRAVFELDGERRDAPAGTLFFVPPGLTRTAVAEEAETSILAVGASPGKRYEMSGWEVWAQLQPLYEAGEYADAADRGRELLEAHPQYAVVAYNLACCESLGGRSAEATEHLRVAIDLHEELRELAKTDSDLDPIRGEPAFQELIGSRVSA